MLGSLLLLALQSAAPPNATAAATAVFAGGCFWCMETPFDEVPGVTATTSGYAGGVEENPTYAQVSAGSTGHFEVVQVTYDPSRVTYEKLLDVFWRNIDPLDASGQFCDKGKQYRSAIFVRTPEERAKAEAARTAVTAKKKWQNPVATQVLAAGRFWPAEDYHQDYAKKNPLRYHAYRRSCGRDARLKELWGG